MPWPETGGLHAQLPGPLPEMRDDMARPYQQEFGKSPLSDEEVMEYGEEKAERLLQKFRVETGRVLPCHTVG